MEQTLKYRDLWRILKRYNVSESKVRGKGSERILSRVVSGGRVSIPTKCHKESDQKPKAVFGAIRRALRLKPEDGVSDKEFYGK